MTHADREPRGSALVDAAAEAIERHVRLVPRSAVAAAGGPVRSARSEDLVRAVAEFAEDAAASRAAAAEASAAAVVARREEAARDEASLAVLRGVVELADSVDGVLPVLEGQAAAAVKALDRKLDRLLAAEGFRRVPGAGSPFDPRWHEAVETDAAAAEGIVVREVARGYVRGDLVLRAARVVVGGER